MGQMLLHRTSALHGASPVTGVGRPRQDPASAARGILLALALSCLAWIGLALLVPRLW